MQRYAAKVPRPTRADSPTLSPVIRPPLSIRGRFVRPSGMNAFHDPVLSSYTLAVVVVSATLLALGFLTAKRRAERKIVINPEDVVVNAGALVADLEHPDVLRLKRAHLNLMESAIPFFALGFLYTLTAPNSTLARALFLVFPLARVLHAVFYVSAKQPLRTAAFALGALVNVVMIVQLARAALAAMF